MHQLDVFTDTPRARSTDPETSHRAAARIKASGALGRQQALVRDWVARYPGHTSAELAREMARERDDDPRLWATYRPMLGRRLPELEPVHVRKGAPRCCEVTGELCIAWWPR